MNTRKKVLLSFGTRPEAIKMAPIYQALIQQPDEFEVLVCVSGQHRELLDQVLDLYNIKPDFDLNVMTATQDLFDVTSSVIMGMRGVLKALNPDIVLVHGDTTTAFASALSAFYMGIKIGHVEAGLRTYNLSSPFPEEFNRQAIGRMANLNFAPTLLAGENLIAEGICKSKIHITGNTVVDALKSMLFELNNNPLKMADLHVWFKKTIGFEADEKKFILITGHRRENFGSGLQDICNALSDLSFKYHDIEFIYPVHPNPSIHEPVYKILGGAHNVKLISPLEYINFVFILSKCYFVLTDSGGVQEEAPSLGKPVLVMRNHTERSEGVDSGLMKIIGTKSVAIVEAVSSLLNDDCEFRSMVGATNPYGNGTASIQIINILRGI